MVCHWKTSFIYLLWGISNSWQPVNMLNRGRLHLSVFSLETIKNLTWTEAVAADGSFGVFWAHITLLALLLGERWIWQRGAFVLWPEWMENQTWDAAARASLFRRLPLLLETQDICQIPSRTSSQISFTLWQVATSSQLVLQMSFQATDSTCKNPNAEGLTSYSWNGPIVPHSLFLPWR